MKDLTTPRPEITTDPSSVPKLLEAWHDYRYVIFFFALLLYITTYISRRRPRQAIRSSWSEKQIWLEEKQPVGLDSKPIIPSNTVSGTPQKSRSLGSHEPSIRAYTGPKRVLGPRLDRRAKTESAETSLIQPLIFFFSLTGSTESLALKLLEKVQQGLEDNSLKTLAPSLHDLSEIDYDEFFISPPKSNEVTQHVQYFYILLMPTYNVDTTLDNFLTHLQETHHDFRIDTAPLSNLAGYSVFGFGDRAGWPTENDGFCSQAIEVDKWMAKLTGKKRAFPLGLGDVKSNAPERLAEWTTGVTNIMIELSDHGGLGEGVFGSGDAAESDEGDPVEVETTSTITRVESLQPGRRKRRPKVSNIDDLEDLGSKARAEIQENDQAKSPSNLPIDFTITTSHTSPVTQIPKAMVPVSSPTYTALTKQGYTIVGTHSGVKTCRWTKSALRGRGSCYKYSFYGIKSHLCMETTPSLSCSNKCVFCWRHGTNPVGTTWRWQVDPPDLIFSGAKEGHYKKIKMMRGVPGVRAERFQEAMKIKHCALSLVGEPIFYPHINELLAMLHAERISSFLVCNAQHPDQLAALKQVTQLYVSIDASNADSLRKIDRPLHRDYWQRFQRCLDILREKRFKMRTVFRLTLVKGFNIDEEVEGYAELVASGLPCFVETKGVTYCGTSSSAGAGLTMQNVPFYEEITAFVEALNAALERRGLGYGIAAEHAHSCCVLIASKRFFVEGKWHTLINYGKFFECLEAGGEFGPEDYMGEPTPEWATWGKGGFDPADERVDRKGRPKGAIKAAGNGTSTTEI